MLDMKPPPRQQTLQGALDATGKKRVPPTPLGRGPASGVASERGEDTKTIAQSRMQKQVARARAEEMLESIRQRDLA
jgi:hypothetical protein